MRDPRSRLRLMTLLALGLFAVTAAGCGGDDETPTPPEATPAETATTATPATEPFPDPTSAPEAALAALEIAGTPEGLRPPVRVVGMMLAEMQEFDCGNTREELAAYTLSAIDVLRDAGVGVLPSDVLVDVSTASAGAGTGGDCQEFFTAYVNAHGG